MDYARACARGPGSVPMAYQKLVGKDAKFLFVPSDQVMQVAEREGAILFDVKGVELGHHGKECSFDAILKKYNLTNDPARARIPPYGISPKPTAFIWATRTINKSTRQSGSSMMPYMLTAKR